MPEHGTIARFTQHVRDGDPRGSYVACGCRKAMTEYVKAWRRNPEMGNRRTCPECGGGMNANNQGTYCGKCKKRARRFRDDVAPGPKTIVGWKKRKGIKVPIYAGGS